MAYFRLGELEARAAFRREALRRIEEARVIWEAFAATRRLRLVDVARGLPAFEGVVQGTNIAVSAVGSVEVGFQTRAIAEARVPMRGTVKVARPGDWEALVAHLSARHFFEDEELDRALVVKSSSASLAHARSMRGWCRPCACSRQSTSSSPTNMARSA